MKEITELLVKESAEIEGLLAQSNRNISKTKNLPNIHVNVCNNNGYEQAYRIDPVSKTRKYIKASDLPSYTKLIQRDYEHAINSKLTQMDKTLKRIIEAYKKVNLSDIELIYSKLANIKKDMIIPIVPDEESFIKSWKEEHPGYQNPFPEGGNVYTQKGEPVRSKSEKIIADLLDKYNIPYVYEPRLELNNMHTVYPDFATLNVRKKKTIYLEHLGLIDVEEYAAKNLQKIAEYEKAGYELGDTLIITTETGLNPLDSRLVESKILKHCL